MKKNIYSYHDSIGRIESVTGVILAGGSSRRMGSDKALLPFGHGRFIESIYRQMVALFPEVIIVCKSPGQYPFLPCRQVSDLVTDCGVLAGLQSGLIHASNPACFVVACDMPLLNADLIRHLCACINSCDIVLPVSTSGDEPLHAVYRRTCLPAIEASIGRGERRIASFFPQVRLRKIPPGEIAAVDPEFASFCNINTPEEYYLLRHVETHRAAGAGPIGLPGALIGRQLGLEVHVLPRTRTGHRPAGTEGADWSITNDFQPGRGQYSGKVQTPFNRRDEL